MSVKSTLANTRSASGAERTGQELLNLAKELVRVFGPPEVIGAW